MRQHHIIAAVFGWTTAAAVIIDTVIHGMTGSRTWVTDDAQGSFIGGLLSGLWLAATFASLAIVLLRERERFLDAPRVARIARRVLLVCLALLALGVGLISTVTDALGIQSGIVYDVSGTFAFVTVVTFSLSALVLSVTVWRRNPLGVGGRVLRLLVPVALATGLLALVAPAGWASPAYCSVVTVVGLSLIGVGVSRNPHGPRATEGRSGSGRGQSTDRDQAPSGNWT